MTPPVVDGEYRVTVSWTNEKNGAVRDVDSYLLIPGVDTPLSYRNVRRDYAGSYLDRDDTDWIGPETVTIKALKSGTYSYYVNNFSERRDRFALGRSNIRVQVYEKSRMIGDYKVPEGEGFSYELFQIVDGRFQPTGRWVNYSYH
jgi:uncharacterized protein YfaP (DUF2135 family)